MTYKAPDYLEDDPWFQNDTDRDNFMSGADAVEYGLIDAVLTSRN